MTEIAEQSVDISGADQIHAPKLKTMHVVGVVVAAAMVVAAIILAGNLIEANSRSEAVHMRYNECVGAASELMGASDYLTNECRMFVLTGDRGYMDAYFDELLVAKRRDEAVATLGAEAGDERASAELVEALAESNALARREFYAMKLVCDASGIVDQPNPVAMVELSSEDDALQPVEKLALARDMALGDKYQQMKAAISQDVDACAEELVKSLERKVLDAELKTEHLLFALLGITFLLMALVLFTAITNYILVTRPMRLHEADMLAGRPLEVTGCYEIQRVSLAYNDLLRRVNERTEVLQHEAETDALTGVLNRGFYDKLLAEQSGDYALVLIDVDRFKQVNDQYGHEVGDEVLQRVARIIDNSFRSSDYVCRIGGDEFAIILPGVGTANKDVIARKLDSISKAVSEDVEGLPNVTVSFGVAFKGNSVSGNLYHDADRALYESKHAGRDQYTFYNEQFDSE